MGVSFFVGSLGILFLLQSGQSVQEVRTHSTPTGVGFRLVSE